MKCPNCNYEIIECRNCGRDINKEKRYVFERGGNGRVDSYLCDICGTKYLGDREQSKIHGMLSKVKKEPQPCRFAPGEDPDLWG